MSEINWSALLRLAGLWLAVVVLALAALDLLFPQLRSGDTPPPARPRRWPRRPFASAARPPDIALPLSDPASGRVHWRNNLALIAVLLLIWVGIVILPVLYAPLLNQITLLTGFPLGYYMGAQGALVVFLGLVSAYAWRAGKLDQRLRALVRRPEDALQQRAAAWRIGRNYLVFTIGFVLFVVLMGLLERWLDLATNIIGWALLVVTVGIYAVIGVNMRASTLDEYYVAGRRIPAFFNGMAIGADWMSAASFISLAGTLWLLGYEGLAYILGWTGGYVLLGLLLAPYLRKFGQFTIPDFVAARYEGQHARVVAAFIGIIISFTYVTAQVTGVGIIMSRFLGVNYLAGVAIGLGAVLFCTYLGGMRAISWTQVAQYIVLLLAYLTPVTLLSLRLTGVPLPQLMYGEALQQITRLEAAQGISNAYVTPFNNWSIGNFIALMLCLMLGTAGMPHILIRFYSVPDVGAARRSVSWALLFICLLYFTAPAYAAFSRWEILQNVVGKPITAVPEWASNWASAGLLTIRDQNGDGILQFNELNIDPDLVVLATPEIANLPHTVAALVAAGGLAAALSTADGLLMVIASAVAHDIYARSINRGATTRERLIIGRVLILLAAVAAAIAATRRLAIIVQLVAWAFSFAAATFFPILVLGIFWKRANGKGAVAGMLCGLGVTLLYMLLNAWDARLNILGISHMAAGIFGVPVNMLAVYIVSKLTAAPAPEVQALVDTLRHP